MKDSMTKKMLAVGLGIVTLLSFGLALAVANNCDNAKTAFVAVFCIAFAVGSLILLAIWAEINS